MLIKRTLNVVLLLTAAMLLPSLAKTQVTQTQAALEAKLRHQYADIQEQFQTVPRTSLHAPSMHLARADWQDELARRFSEAAITVEEILRLSPANADLWRERLETLRLYAQPISSPRQRTIYGAREVNKKAKLIDMPVAAYTAEARQAKARDEVRLRLVLAGDGTIRNIFPIKSAEHGLTESAVTAALQIKFEPALRNGSPVSQFVTLVYEFKKKDAKPIIPRTVF